MNRQPNEGLAPNAMSKTRLRGNLLLVGVGGTGALALVALLLAVSVILGVVEPEPLAADDPDERILHAFIYAIPMVAYLFAGIIWMIWGSGIARNLHKAGRAEMQMSPLGVALWWIVPIATYFKPRQGLQQMLDASHAGATEPSESDHIARFWVLWVLWNIVSSIAGWLPDTVDIMVLTWAAAINNAFTLALSVAAVPMIRTITQAHIAFIERSQAGTLPISELVPMTNW